MLTMRPPPRPTRTDTLVPYTTLFRSVYNLHLLTGKIAEPGNSPFSLTGQPSACGTAREVGTFSHRLPADMAVANPKHRAITEKIWKLPEGTIQEKPGFHAVEQSRKLKDGVLQVYLTTEIGRAACRERGCQYG